MRYFIGLDVGTTGAKSLLIDEGGTVVASATAEYSYSTPYPLWAEQDPENWWQGTVTSIRKVIRESGIQPAHVSGIGLSGQMHGLVLLDKTGSVLRPCIMWNDQRTGSQCESITHAVGFDHLLELTGNPVLPGFTAPKILWVRENEPKIFQQISTILLPKDYIRYRLTGDFATDVSDASGTSLFHVSHRLWSTVMLEALEIPGEWLPVLNESQEVTGTLTKTASEEIGLSTGVPVVARGGDQAAGAVGTGVVMPGVISVVLGTSGVVFAHSEQFTIEPQGRLHAFCHAVPGAWHLMGVTLAAGGSLRWFRDELGQMEVVEAQRTGKDTYRLLTSMADKATPGSEGLFFLPYLSGERTPYPDPFARGSFIGLTTRHGRPELVRSLLEGVAFSLKDCLELVKSTGVEINQIRISGGGARSPIWRQIMANVFEHELVTLTSTEGAPYGAALLAAVGTGYFQSVREACGATLVIDTRTVPDQSQISLYRQAYDVYRGLYHALKPAFELIANPERK